MANYIEVKVSYTRMQENGKSKKVTDAYIVDALSFTEAEALIIAELESYQYADMDVCAVRKSNIKEIQMADTHDALKFYKAKLQFISIDEKKGEERLTPYFVLVQASDIEAALKQVDDLMRGSMVDYNIHTIAETGIVDVFENVNNE